MFTRQSQAVVLVMGEKSGSIRSEKKKLNAEDEEDEEVGGGVGKWEGKVDSKTQDEKEEERRQKTEDRR